MKRGPPNVANPGSKRYGLSLSNGVTDNSPATSYTSRARMAAASVTSLISQPSPNNSNYVQPSSRYSNQLGNYTNQSSNYTTNASNLNLQQSASNYGNLSNAPSVDQSTASFNNAVAYLNYYQAYSAVAAAAESFTNHGLMMDSTNYAWGAPNIQPPPEFNLSQPPPPPPLTSYPSSNNMMSSPTRGRSYNARGGGRGGNSNASRVRNASSCGSTASQHTSVGMNSPRVPPSQAHEWSNSNVNSFMESDLEAVGRVGITINKKAKRKPMSSHYTSKEWNREDALRALAVEREIHQSEEKAPMLILKFPDEDLNKEIVKGYSPFIENVHFQQPSTPRYCFVQLKKDANVKEAIDSISKIKFGTGMICAEHKFTAIEQEQVTPEDIDPYTLYVGNLPTNVKVQKVKSKFPNATRIDIGFAQRMKFTRYAFVRYDSIEESMAALRATFNLELGSRSLVVRFRRNKGNVGSSMSSEVGQPTGKYPVFDHIHDDDLSTQSTENIENVSDTCSLASEMNADPDLDIDSKANVVADAQRQMELTNQLAKSATYTSAATINTLTTAKPTTATPEPETTITNTTNTSSIMSNKIPAKPSESLDQSLSNNVSVKIEKDTEVAEVPAMPVCLLGTKIKREEVEVNQMNACDNLPDSDDEFFSAPAGDEDSDYEEESRIKNNFMVDDESDDSDYQYWERGMLPEVKKENDTSSAKHESSDVRKRMPVVQNASHRKADIGQVKKTGSGSDDELDSLFDELNPDDGFQF